MAENVFAQLINGVWVCTTQYTINNQACDVQWGLIRDPLTMLGLSVTPNGTPGTNGITVANLPIAANQSVPINVTAAGTVTLVPAVAGERVYISAYNFVSNGLGTVELTDTSGGALTGAIPVSQEAGDSAGNGAAPILFTASGLGVQIVVTGSATAQGFLTFAQQ